jgi:hypothetical protein
MYSLSPTSSFKVCALTVALTVARAGAAGDERRITKATNVRLRSAAATSASIAAELPLGTELAVVGRANATDRWYHVRADDGRDGWVLGRLTAPLSLERRDQAIESIIVDRLRGGGDFSSGLQLFDLIERTAAELTDREAQARFALYRLRSMTIVFLGIPFRRGESDPYRRWIRDHRDAARYDEPGGTWMVDPQYVTGVHDTYRGTAAAEDIAWFLAQHGLYGECEGDVPCYVDRTNRLEGWYLRTYPGGRHTDDANGRIALKLNDYMDNLGRFPSVLAQFDPGTRCGELRLSLDPLASAVMATISARKPGALAAIDRFAQLCR